MAHGRPAKRRRLTPPLDDGVVSETIDASDLFARAADWDLEQDYERRTRHKKVRESTKLPIKTAEGRIQRVEEKANSVDESDNSFLGSGSEGEEDLETTTTTVTAPPDDAKTVPQLPLKQQLLAAKEEIAQIAELLNEDPEEHAGSFKQLAQVGGPGTPLAIQKLVLAAQAAVYKDVIPDYRIRSYKDEDLGSKVSKEVRRTRQYERALVTGYQGYVKHLHSLAKSKSENDEQSSLRSVAINCVCTLLLSVPHFNFRTELLNVMVHELASRHATADFARCIQTLEAFFAADDDGAPSLEAVSLLTKMMKAKSYRVREEVLNTFFHLRLLSELSARSSSTHRENVDGVSKMHGRRVKKEKWEHRSKNERKFDRERKAVEKDMRQADALVTHEDREKMQSETLKLVFATYFRILKARIPDLMGAVLEGLAKSAHLINQDFFGDILEALKDIINHAEAAGNGDSDDDAQEERGQHDERRSIRNRTRESLLSTQTAFTLLSGQEASKSASALHLDLSFFTSHVYRSLYALALDPDIEPGPQTLHLSDPHSAAQAPRQEISKKVNVSTPVLLLTRVLMSILLTPSQPPPTLAAASFFKRLLTLCLQLPEKSTLAVLHLMTKFAEKHGRKIEPLWYSDERKGDGVYRGDSETVEGTNVLAVGSGVWELELLRHHYCPKVRDQVKVIDNIMAGLAG